MGKLLVTVLYTFFSFSIFGQSLASVEETEKKETEKTTHPAEEKEEFGLHYNVCLGLSSRFEKKTQSPILGLDVLYLTRRQTYHFVGYDFLSREFNTTHGYKWSKHIGTYAFFSYALEKHESEIHLSNEKIISLGGEYFVPYNYGEIIIFSEFAKSFPLEENMLRFGFIAELDFRKIVKK